MKRIISSIIVSILLVTAPVLYTGCGTFQTTTYKVSGVTQTTVETAMRAWGDYVAKYHPGVAREAQVKDAYLKYQVATLAVIDTAVAYQKAVAANDPAASNLQNQLNTAVATASAALGGLVGILQAFGVNIQ